MGVMRRFRSKSAVRVADFVRKFPWKSFLIQAPQVTADMWGVGLQLGGIMGVMADVIYAPIRLLQGESVVVRLPPPSDPLGKALNYLNGGSTHLAGGGWLSYEDHWLLLAADVVATTIVMQNFSALEFERHIDTWLPSKIVYHEPWLPATREVLFENGWIEGGPYHPPYAGFGPDTTYAQLMEEEARRFPAFLQEARLDFPAKTHASVFQLVAADLAEELLTWGTGTDRIGKDVFEPKELAFARLFEAGVFPPGETGNEVMDFMLDRSLEISRALGRELPARFDLQQAAIEVWGGFSGE